MQHPGSVWNSVPWLRLDSGVYFDQPRTVCQGLGVQSRQFCGVCICGGADSVAWAAVVATNSWPATAGVEFDLSGANWIGAGVGYELGYPPGDLRA